MTNHQILLQRQTLSVLFVFQKCWCQKNAKEEQEENTPITPKRSSWTLTKEDDTSCGIYKRTNSSQEYDDERGSYIHPNAIQAWQIKELENLKALNGNVMLQDQHYLKHVPLGQAKCDVINLLRVILWNDVFNIY